MAAAPVPQPSGAPPPQAASGAGNSPQGGPAVLQLVALISKASDQLAQVFPAGAPMAEEIQNQLSLVQQKMAATTSPQQPSAPPI